jgi:uncharacterized membrane protein YedE/YeeE
MIEITPLSAIVGGTTLGLSTLFFRVVFGRVLGISGIFGRIFDNIPDKTWRICFTLGLFSAGVMLPSTPTSLTTDTKMLVAAGALVGFGTNMGSGCTSGHGLVGLARFSLRSWVAVPVFMMSGMMTRMFMTTETFTTVAPVIVNEISLRTEYLLGSVLGIFGLAYLSAPFFKETNHVNWLTDIYSFAIGGMFGLGLIVGGMTQPQKVFEFLQFPSLFLSRPEDAYASFDPSLMILMMAGMLPSLLLNPVIENRLEEPLLAKEHCMPSKTQITWRLVVGAAVFGVGWGLVGVCPGPGIVQASRILLGEFEMLKWIAGFLVGTKISQLI